MPQAVVVAAIPAAAAIAGGVISSRAQGKAVKAQQAAADKAIAYERERAAEAKKERQAAAINWQKRYDAYINRFFGGGGGGAAGGGAAPSFASGPRADVSSGGGSIAELLQNMGQLQSNSALASGDMWGNTLTQAGAGIGQAIKDRPVKPQATLTGEMQPTGVAQPGLTPWQPAPMPRGPQDDWSNWQRYYGSGL